MVTFFTADEMLDIAVGIEKNGQAFYKSLADRAYTESARSMYQFLADAEKHHEAIFERMRREGIKITLPESYQGEYQTYLKSLIDTLVFQNSRDVKTSRKGGSEIDALTTGIQAEKDSILFYSEMLNLSRETDRATLDGIIKEEKSHLRQLSEMKAYLERPRGG